MASHPEDTIVSEKLSDGRGVIQQLDGSPRLGRFGVVSRAPASTTVSCYFVEYVVPMHLIALGFIYAHDLLFRCLVIVILPSQTVIFIFGGITSHEVVTLNCCWDVDLATLPIAYHYKQRQYQSPFW